MGKHHRENLFSDYAFVCIRGFEWWRVPNAFVPQGVSLGYGLISTPEGNRTIDDEGRIFDDATR